MALTFITKHDKPVDKPVVSEEQQAADKAFAELTKNHTPLEVGKALLQVLDANGYTQPSTLKEAISDFADATALAEMVSTPVVAPAESVATEEEKLASELITLYVKLESLGISAIQKRMDEIKKKLQSIANEEIEDGSPAIFKCETGEVEFSKRSETKVFKDPGTLLSNLVDKFGMEAVEKVVKIGVGELGKLLSENEMAQYFEVKPGSRSLKEVRPKK